MVHSSSKNGVIINNIGQKYYVKRYVTARRILSDAQYGKIATAIEQNADSDAAANVAQ